MFNHLGHQATHIGSLDPDTRHDFGGTIGPNQIDFRLSRPSDVNVGRFMIKRVDHEPKAMSPIHDNHG